VLIYVLSNKTMGEHKPRVFARGIMCGQRCSSAALVLRWLTGPGTGNLMFVFVRLYSYDFLNAAASARVLNVATSSPH
jgi:hypothetical protein